MHLSNPSERFIQYIDAWLLVWAGSGDWQARVGKVLEAITTAADNAHTILSQEINNGRWSLLLVHYSRDECDLVVGALEDGWDYGFVNAVLDLEDIDVYPHTRTAHRTQ